DAEKAKNRLQSLRNRFLNATQRPQKPMDPDFADIFTGKIEDKLSQIDPNWNKDQDDDLDAIFDKAISKAEAAATSSQSPVRTEGDSFDQFLQETDIDDDVLLSNAINAASGSNTPTTPENRTQAPLTKLEETIRNSVLRGDGNTDVWYKANADLILKLVQAGELPEAAIEKHRQVIEAAATAQKPTVELGNKTSFSQLNLEYTRVLSQIKKGENLTPQEKQLLAEKKAALESQISGFIDQARQNGLLADIDSKYLSFQVKIEAYLGDLMEPEEKASFEKQITSWSVSDKGKDPDLQGIREAYVQRLKGEMKGKITAAKNTEEVFMKQVRNDSEASIPKRVEGIEKRAAEEQRKALRVFLDTLESTDKGRFDSPTNNLMSELIRVADRKGIYAEVRAEVYARIHLHSCAISLRRVNTSEADKVSSEFNRAVSEIGDYTLKGSDFEVLLQKGLPGLDISDAFQVLQEAAYRGEFSGKTTETEAAEKRQVLVSEILRRAKNPSFDIAAAEKSYDLAMRIAEATLEKSVWDTSGGDYLSQAIYFSKWRAKEGGKGPQVTIDMIHSIGTSFFRSATTATEKYNDKSTRIINKDEWKYVIDQGKTLKDKYDRDVAATTNAFKSGRYQSLALQRIQTEADSVILAEQFYPEDRDTAARNRFLQQEQSETDIRLNSKPKGMLDFDQTKVDFGSMSSTAYKDYLTSTIPSILKAKDLLTKVDITAKDLQNDSNFLSWADTLDRVDPNGVMSLRFWFLTGAMDVALNSGMEWSEAYRVAARLHKDKKSGKGIFTFLPKHLPNGESVRDNMLEIISGRARGLSNKTTNFLENNLKITNR
ncbi:hypothetical protein KBA63_03870, partial [Candidatus Woesebacteria bacterium]|nr:hypothetical protein [Candidatus Woesebacteria bacterium]